MRHNWQRLVNWLSATLTLPGDSDSVRVRKVTVALVTLGVIPISLVWSVSLIGIMPDLAVVNFAYAASAMLAVLYLIRTRNFAVFLNGFFASTLAFLMVVHYGLGGFTASGPAINTALIIPLAGALLLGRRNTYLWAGLYIAAHVGLLALDGRAAAAAPNLPVNFGVVNGFFSVLVTTAMSVGMIFYLVRQLAEAQERADSLLYNMLPRRIAARLKKEPGIIAEERDSASVLFADIVGFTPLSAELQPAEMVDLLNRLYSQFDALAEKHGVEKIRTIGDNYMAAAGVTSPRPDHAQALARLALDARDYCESLGPVGGGILELRIGIHSGSLIAGVVGTSRLQYDIWGDTVNTASRMESHGLPGKVQVSEATYDSLKDEFSLTARGTIDVKGKGEMQTWFLTGPKGSGG